LRDVKKRRAQAGFAIKWRVAALYFGLILHSITRIFGVLALLVCTSIPALAWGCEGHKTVALIARRHLTPKARTQVDALLARFPYNPVANFNCEPRNSPMADASLWADDIRNARRETAPWHYQDIPMGDSGENPAQFCPNEGCVTRAIREQIAKLKGSTELTEERAEALRYVLHFVGDMHQPLHATTNNDAGGNCVPVNFFERRTNPNNPEKRSYSPNLHSVWDTEILRRFLYPFVSATAMADRLDIAFRGSRQQLSAGTLEEWLREGFEHSKAVVYGKLTPTASQSAELIAQLKGEAEQSGCQGLAERNAARNITIDDRYQQAAEPVIMEQLAKAGYRLARLLNETFGQ
jgi:hypothetical protein